MGLLNYSGDARKRPTLTPVVCSAPNGCSIYTPASSDILIHPRRRA